jgi:hypothetical protein
MIMESWAVCLVLLITKENGRMRNEQGGKPAPAQHAYESLHSQSPPCAADLFVEFIHMAPPVKYPNRIT